MKAVYPTKALASGIGHLCEDNGYPDDNVPKGDGGFGETSGRQIEAMIGLMPLWPPPL